MEDDNSQVLTPSNPRYALRSRTPRTPVTPSHSQRPASTPITSGRPLNHGSTTDSPLATPIDKLGKSVSLNRTNSTSLATPTDKPGRTPSLNRTNSSSTPKEKLVFRTPMAFKPRMVGNKPVPSPSRQDVWKEQMGFEDEPSQESDKENSEEEDAENQKDHASVVEYRALQKVLAEKTAQRDETLLQNKSYKDKLRQMKSRLERQEATKRQQLKILRKSHETQIQDKDQLIDNLQSIINEQEERLKEFEDAAVSTPRSKRKARPSPVTSPTPINTTALVEDIKRLQTEKASLTSQLNELQFELDSVREDTSREIESLKESLQHFDKVHETSLRYNQQQSELSQQCCTDTEKQVDVLQAENERLMVSLTEVKQAHTKAVTVSKLSTHRQQQLDEEVRRYKGRVGQLEKDLDHQSQQISELQACRQEALAKTEENVKLQARIRDLQAQLLTLQSNTANHVSQETAAKEVETLRKHYEVSKVEMHSLKKTCDDKKQEMLEMSAKVKYLERMLAMTQAQKEDADQSLWREVDSMSQEHQTKLAQLRDQLQLQHQKDIRKMENRLSYEHKKELHSVCENLTAKHKAALTALEEEYRSQQEEHENEISKLEEGKSRILLEMEQEISQTVSRCEEEKKVLQKRQKLELTKLEEDLGISKQAAVSQLREQMNRERETILQQTKHELETKHSELLEKLESDWRQKTEAALLRQKEETTTRMADLERRHSDLAQRLVLLNPVLSQFVEAFILLQREVKEFPRIIKSTVESVKRQMTEAIVGISEYNKELVSKYQKEMKLRKKYHNELVELKGNIRVFCRIRPPIKEDGHGQMAEEVVSIDSDDDGVVYVNSKGRVQTFDVDRVFGNTSTQSEVFDEVKALVTSCIDGYNVCIFAYGQTGSGKTYTMEGNPDSPGINQRALAQLFEDTDTRGADWRYVITVSVIEIYNEMIRDLLSEDPSFKMEVKMNPDGGFHIPGLCFVTVSSVADVNQCFNVGQKNRATATTNMNEHSSRSHCLLCVTVIGTNITTGVKTTGKLNLVDLAGSERVSKSKADGARLKEAQNINKSLSCIGDVIFALRSKQSYIPYRNSKLTYLLQDSLGGDSKTLMITQISPVRKNEGETICSLNFAQRVRNVELGAATRKWENGDLAESDPSSPARTPQRGTGGLKPSTPSSSSKLTPLSRQTRKK